MPDDNEKPKPAADDEISEEVLQWIAGGAHGCPSCPHPPTAIGPQFNAGSHILVDGSIFEDGQFKRKL
jgi:hypothetical protein